MFEHRRTHNWSAAIAAVAGVVVWFAPLGARAAGGGDSGGGIEIFLVLVAVVAAAYLVAHLLIERVANRFGVATGIEYVVLGAVVFRFLAAPVVPGAEGKPLATQVDLLLEKLRPVLVLGTGSLGLMWGTHVDVRDIDALDRASFGPALIISALTFGAVAGLPGAAVAYFYSLERLVDLMPLLLCAGAVGMVASDGPIRSLVSFLEPEGEAPEVAVRLTTWSSALAIVVFGMLFCFDHAGPLHPDAGPAPLQWLFVHLIVGITLGLIFGTFLRRDFADEKILTVIIGMVVFTSGLAHGLELSPIFVNFVLGCVLINTCRNGDHVRSRLESIKYPLYIVLYLFAGAMLDLSVPWWTYALAIPYLILRIAGRWFGGLVASPTPESVPGIPAVGRVLHAPGALSVAMAIDFASVYADRGINSPFIGATEDVEIFYVVLIVGIIVSEILAHWMTRSWLIDATDIPTSEDSPARPGPTASLREEAE